MQHLDRRLEHLDEFHQPLRRAVEAAGEGIGVGIVLAVHLQLADIDLANEAGDVLVVLVAGFGLGDADLLQPRRLHPHHGEFGDVAAEFLEALDRPRRDGAGEPPLRDAVALLDLFAESQRVEQAERAFENRADIVAGFQSVDRLLLHQLLQPLGQRRFAAADRAQQVQHLLALLEALRGMAEEPDDPLDRVLHAEEIVGEGRVDLDGPVHENAAQARILGGVDHDRFADRLKQPLGGPGIKCRVVRTSAQIVFEAVLYLATVLVGLRVKSKDAIVESHFSPQSTACRPQELCSVTR